MKRLMLVLISCFCVLQIGKAQTNEQVYESAENFIFNSEYDKAISVLDKLVKKNDAKALFMLGNVFDRQYKNDEAVLYWTKSAEQGFAPAQNKLASHYIYDKEKQKYWAQKALQQYIILANKGNTDAMVSVGDLYASGWLEEEEDKKKAIEWYEKAVNKGNTTAMDKLGWIYWNKDEIEKSFEYFLQGAKKGDYDCRGGVGMIIYNHGKDYPQLVDAFSLFCTAFFEDEGTINSWYYRAANMGSPEAEASIGWYLLEEGKFEEAKQRLEKAKNKGVDWITVAYGSYYLESVLGVTKFYIKNADYKHEYSKGNFIDGGEVTYLITKKDDKAGVAKINNNGDMISVFIPFNYDYVDFRNNKFIVVIDGEEEEFTIK